MEYYESTCPDCGHRWRWVGFKTGIGKTPAQLEEMRRRERTCTKCGSENAKTGLDHSSPQAKAMDEAMGSVVKHLFGKEGEE